MIASTSKGTKAWGFCAVVCAAAFAASDVGAQETVDAGVTGFDAKRPVLASACNHGCPWGELGDFVTDALKPLGYEVIQCRNCNMDKGPGLVSTAAYPPELTAVDTFVGTTTRVAAPVDFGITSSDFLGWAYGGLHTYAEKGALANLRLIAKIEDPTYLLVAVKADSGISDLSQVAERKLPVKILGGGSPLSQPVLDYYGLTPDAVASWGGVYENALVFGQGDDPPFDIVITELASPANNPESAYWTKISQKHDLRFLDLPASVLDALEKDRSLGVTRATARWGLLRGLDRPIATVARSGHAVFARDDAPEQAAYDVAKAIDEHRGDLKWFIRPYSYDSRTVWENLGVPLHPGAERYYRQVGYLGEASDEGTCAGDASLGTAGATPSKADPSASGSSCSVRGTTRSTAPGFALLSVAIGLLVIRRRGRKTSRPGRLATRIGIPRS